MNRDALNELFDFTTFTWETYARMMRGLTDADLVRPLENAGWTTLREPLVHLAAAWDGYLSEKAGQEFAEFDLDTVVTWAAVQSVRAQGRGWMRGILDDMTDAQLFEETSPTWDAQPDASRSTVSDVILHILLHERGHHGDVTTLFSRLGVAVPNSDFLVYQFFKNRRT